MIVKTNQIIRLLLAVSLLLLSVAVGGAAASSVTADTALLITSSDGLVTVPIYLTGAEEIISFAAEVSNSVDGAILTINETMLPEGGMHAVNSQTDTDVQKIAWISASGVTADKMLLFAVDIRITDPTVSFVPVQFTVTELGSNSAGSLPQEYYAVTPVSEFRISDTVTGSVSFLKDSPQITYPIESPAAPSTQLPAVSETPVQTPSATTVLDETTVPSTDTVLPIVPPSAPMSTATSPLSGITALTAAALAGHLCCVLRRKA